MHIEDVDPEEAAQFGRWFAVVDAVGQHGRPGEQGWLPQELREAGLAGRPGAEGSEPDELYELTVACEHGRVVGAARLELPLADNRHTAGIEVWVLPQARRRGAGTALLERTRDRAEQEGRTTLMGDLDEPPALEGGSAGRAFLLRHGFSFVLDEVRRDLALPVPAERLDELERACAPHARDYRVLTWRDRVPDELLDDRAELARQMSTDVPLGKLSWGEETWDGARVRRREDLLSRQGRGCIGAGAVHVGSGTLVAFTELAVPLAAPTLVHQWETMVLGPHRGHRLGLLVKVAALRRLQAEVPQARTVATGNARSNGPMIAVNEALGFVPNGTIGSWERPVST